MNGMEKKLILYGASESGRAALKYYGRERVECFCDSSPSKVGTLIDGVRVIGVDELKAYREQAQIIITSHSYENIRLYLEGEGMDNISGAFFMKEILFGGGDGDRTELQEVRNALRLRELLPERKRADLPSDGGSGTGTGARKACFLVSTLVTWNILESVYKAFAGDSQWEPVILLTDAYGESMAEKTAFFRKQGIRTRSLEEYDLEQANPVFFFVDVWMDYTKLSDSEKKRIMDFGGRIVYIPYMIFVFYETTDVSVFDLDKDSWRTIVNKDFYEEFHGRVKNLAPLGNPKFDSIYRAVSRQEEIPKAWEEKRRGRKTFLWNTMYFSRDEQGIIPYFNLDRWGRHVFDVFARRDDCALLFRPHPGLMSSLTGSGIWTKKEQQTFLDYLEESDNIIYDDTVHYGPAFRISDALMSATSGLLVSYLPTGKPILYMPSYREPKGIYNKTLESVYYQADSGDDIGRFVDRVLAGDDPLRQNRQDVYSRFFPPFDGCVGERIKEYVCGEYRRERER